MYLRLAPSVTHAVHIHFIDGDTCHVPGQSRSELFKCNTPTQKLEKEINAYLCVPSPARPFRPLENWNACTIHIPLAMIELRLQPINYVY